MDRAALALALIVSFAAAGWFYSKNPKPPLPSGETAFPSIEWQSASTYTSPPSERVVTTDIEKARRYCRYVVFNRSTDAKTQAPDNAWDKAELCAVLIVAQIEQKEIAIEDREIIHYANQAKTLWNQIQKGDLKSQTYLHLAKDNTDPQDYISTLYQQHNVERLESKTFKIKVLENEQMPIPLNTVIWLDNSNVIYNTLIKKNPVDWPSGSPNPDYKTTVIFNLDTFAIRSDVQSAYDAAVEAKKSLYPPVKTETNCSSLPNSTGIACYIPMTDAVNPDGSYKDIDPYSIVIKTAEGNDKKLIFDRPLFPEVIPSILPSIFQYDEHSKQYWIQHEYKVWRFDRAFNDAGVKEYPKGFWGTSTCWMSKWKHKFPAPCNFLSYPMHGGFLISRSISVLNADYERERAFNLGFLLFMTNEGRVIEISAGENQPTSISTSPDGCKAIFTKAFKIKDQTNSAGFAQKMAIVDLCVKSTHEAAP